MIFIYDCYSRNISGCPLFRTDDDGTIRDTHRDGGTITVIAFCGYRH